MLLEKIAVSKGKSIFFTRERKFFREGEFVAFNVLFAARLQLIS